MIRRPPRSTPLSLHDALPIWLHYLMEYEYLTAAGRWFRGPITPKIAASVTAANATNVLEELDWYFRRDRSARSEEHTSELQSQSNLVCRLLLEKKQIGRPLHR